MISGSSPRAFLPKWLGIATVGLSALAASGASHAAPVTISAGWDILQTQTAYFNMGPLGLQQFMGVPIGSADLSTLQGAQGPFPAVGVQNYGNTDTVVYRAMDQLVGSNILNNSGDFTISSINMTALQLVSANSINMGFGNHTYYATLSTVLPQPGHTLGTGCAVGQLGQNEMCLSYNGTDGGTFNANLTFTIDLHRDSLTGVVDLSTQKTFLTTNANWFTTPTGLVIAGVNDDSFFTGTTLHDAGGGTTHTTDPVPEPATLALLAGALGLLGFARRRAA